MIATPASDSSFALAESPVWNPRTAQLHWIDVSAGTLLTGRIDGERIVTERTTTLTGSIGAVVIADDGSLIVANHDRLVSIDPMGGRRETPALLDGSVRRFNDGGVDAQGRMLIGTLRLTGATHKEQLMQFSDGNTAIIDENLTMSNGLAWSVDGSRLYSVDTLARTVRVRNYDGETGAVGDWTLFTRLPSGYPDGICVDADDHLWIAVWGEGTVLRYAPTGNSVDRVHVPAPNVSSVAFAGGSLDTLVITTARDDLTPGQREAYTDSGRLFMARPGISGLPSHRVNDRVLSHLFGGEPAAASSDDESAHSQPIVAAATTERPPNEALSLPVGSVRSATIRPPHRGQ